MRRSGKVRCSPVISHYEKEEEVGRTNGRRERVGGSEQRRHSNAKKYDGAAPCGDEKETRRRVEIK